MEYVRTVPAPAQKCVIGTRSRGWSLPVFIKNLHIPSVPIKLTSPSAMLVQAHRLCRNISAMAHRELHNHDPLLGTRSLHLSLVCKISGKPGILADACKKIRRPRRPRLVGTPSASERRVAQSLIYLLVKWVLQAPPDGMVRIQPSSVKWANRKQALSPD